MCEPGHGGNRKDLFTELGRRGACQTIGCRVAIARESIEILLTTADRLDWPVWLGDAALTPCLTALPFVVLRKNPFLAG